MTMRKVSIEIDGLVHELDVEPRLLLSDALRHHAGKAGVHVGCEQGVCGACTVMLDDVPIRSCLMLAVQAHEARITTVHGLSENRGLTHEQRALHEAGAVQCGFCTPGILITLTAARRTGGLPQTDAEIRELLSGHLCRCTGYASLVAAVTKLSAHDD
jgi:aerobic-type carbon monoxide dehydrogenase small subunit (CoxS/CutS family)